MTTKGTRLYNDYKRYTTKTYYWTYSGQSNTLKGLFAKVLNSAVWFIDTSGSS